MVEPVHVNDVVGDLNGEIDHKSRQVTKDAIERTLIDMGIAPEDAVVCSNELRGPEDYFNGINSDLEQLGKEIAERQSNGFYDEFPEELAEDRKRLTDLKSKKNSTSVTYSFDGLDSILYESASRNALEAGVDSRRFGIYDRKSLAKITGREYLYDVVLTEEQLEEVKILDFVPRYMGTAQIILWIMKQHFNQVILNRKQLLSEGVPDTAAGQEMMDWMGRIANAHGREESSSALIAVLNDYGINVNVDNEN